jgi:hypothetical protein
MSFYIGKHIEVAEINQNKNEIRMLLHVKPDECQDYNRYVQQGVCYLAREGFITLEVGKTWATRTTIVNT